MSLELGFGLRFMVNISVIILLIKNNDNGSGFLEYNRFDPLNPELDQSIYTVTQKG